MTSAPSASTSPGIAADLARAHDAADYLTRLSTPALQAIFRETPTWPLADLVNRRDVRVDLPHHRIWRDAFWKGSFARDHVFGWDERWLTPKAADGSPFAGGRFWKRFDTIRDGIATGLVVNYNLHLLPGRPEVREVVYPDDRRRYARAGDTVLLLTYLNAPYRSVYDTIKIVGPDTAIGVMHLGRFPGGREVATFVMSRQNYPFEFMTVPDHDALFGSGPSRPPRPDEVLGSWRGRLVLVRDADRTMHNQFNPPWAALDVDRNGARIRIGLSSRRARLAPSGDLLSLSADGRGRDDFRLLGNETLLGRRYRAAATGPSWRYVLRRREPPQ